MPAAPVPPAPPPAATAPRRRHHPSETTRRRRHEQWETKRVAVEAFHEHAGRWPYPHAEDPAERSLGSWLYTQRATQARGALSPERAEAMAVMAERVGEPWTASRRWRRSAPPGFYA